MGETTGVEWTDHTGNIVIGCERISQACRDCYAARERITGVLEAQMSEREGRRVKLWGPADSTPRYVTKGWEKNLLAWDRAARRKGVRRRAFFCSLSDIFEAHPTWDTVRPHAFEVFASLTNIDVQALTKRPENIRRMVPPAWLESWPAHVWIGTTVEDQENAERRIPHLLAVPAPVRFLSVEPQIGPVDLTDLILHDGAPGEAHYSALDCDVDPEDDGDWNGARIAWVICGGESGSKARPFDLAWARSLRDQCRTAGVPFFLKQLGANVATDMSVDDARRERLTLTERLDDVGARIMDGRWRLRLVDSHGGDESEWPADLRNCRAFP